MKKRKPEIEEEILRRIGEGEPLRAICRSDGMPAWRTVYDWMEADADLAARFARARVTGFDAIAEDCLVIANTPELGVIRTVKPDGAIEERQEDMLGHRKLQIETRLKLLAKWDPKRYGEKIEHEHKGAVTLQLTATDEKL